MSRVRISSNVARLNELLNSPEIYPHVHGDIEGPLDARPAMKHSVLLEAEHGIFWFVNKGHGVWEAHTVFPPGARGTVKCAKDAIAFMKKLPGYTKIVTQCPRTNPRAKRFLQKLNFSFTHTEGVYQNQPLDYYEYI